MMNWFRTALLIGLLMAEVLAVSLTDDTFDLARAPDSQIAGSQTALPVLEKTPAAPKFAARFEQPAPALAGEEITPATVTETSKAPKPASETHAFVVLFDFDSVRLGPAAQKALDAAAEIARQGRQIRIFATGHADASGPDSYNHWLSRRRIEMVRRAFRERGLAPEQIDGLALGEKNPRIASPDGAPNAHNRRVEIIVGPAPKI